MTAGKKTTNRKAQIRRRGFLKIIFEMAFFLRQSRRLAQFFLLLYYTETGYGVKAFRHAYGKQVRPVPYLRTESARTRHQSHKVCPPLFITASMCSSSSPQSGLPSNIFKFSANCVTLLAPTITDVTARWVNTQRKANCASVSPRALASCFKVCKRFNKSGVSCSGLSVASRRMRESPGIPSR